MSRERPTVRRGLGRGLGSLIPTAPTDEAPSETETAPGTEESTPDLVVALSTLGSGAMISSPAQSLAPAASPSTWRWYLRVTALALIALALGAILWAFFFA